MIYKPTASDLFCNLPASEFFTIFFGYMAAAYLASRLAYDLLTWTVVGVLRSIREKIENAEYTDGD